MTACLPACSQISFSDSLIWNTSSKTSHLASSLLLLWVNVIPQLSHELYSSIVLCEHIAVGWTSNGWYSPLCQRWHNQHSCLWKIIRFPFLTGYSQERRAWKLGRPDVRSIHEKTCEEMEGFRHKGSFLSKLLWDTTSGDVMTTYLIQWKSGRIPGALNLLITMFTKKWMTRENYKERKQISDKDRWEQKKKKFLKKLNQGEQRRNINNLSKESNNKFWDNWKNEH